MPRRAFPLLSLLLLLGLVGCDHATKHLAQAGLRGHPPTRLIAGVLDLSYVENRDVAFSLLRGVPEQVRVPLIFAAGAVMLAVVGGMWWRRRGARWPEHLAYTLILAGALGNLTDRLFRGYVVDFVYLHHWPVFNVADALLVVGVAVLLLGGYSLSSSKMSLRDEALRARSNQ